MYPKVLRELADITVKPLCNSLSITATGRSVQRLEESKHDASILQEWLKMTYKALHPGTNSPRHQDMLVSTQLESSSVEKHMAVLAGIKLDTSQQCAPIKRRLMDPGLHWEDLGRWYFPSTQQWWHTWTAMSSSRLPSRKMWRYLREHSKEKQRQWRDQSQEEKLWELRLFNLESRGSHQ